MLDDLAHGWPILLEQAHRHNAAVWIAIFVAVWIPIWAAQREKKDKEPEAPDFRPITRTPIPGSEKDYRSERTRLD